MKKEYIIIITMPKNKIELIFCWTLGIIIAGILCLGSTSFIWLILDAILS